MKQPPLYAVRTALGLSMQDAAIILNDADHPALKMDDDPSEELALLAEMVGDMSPQGEVILKITNPDDTTFKEWKVTRSGHLEEIAPDSTPKEDTSGMVLRTVYLPESLDNMLRQKAHERGVSKGQIIREACQALVEEMTSGD